MIKTKRLTLREIMSGDETAVFNYRSDKISNKYQGWIPESIEEVKQFIAQNPAEFNRAQTWFQLVICFDQKVIGDIGVHFIDPDNKLCEIGFTLHKDYQGNGFAYEALCALITMLFEKYNKHKVTASTDPNNYNSIKLLNRLQFKKEAHIRESIWFKGKWVDDVIFGALKSDEVHKNYPS